MEGRRSQIVLGLDPDPNALWSTAGEPVRGISAESSSAERAAIAVADHCRTLIDATAQACVATKLQLACFERLGAPGWSALEAVAEHARAQGLLVIADGKRGDISVSASAYAQALLGGTQTPFGEVAGLGADMVTVNPLLGRDAIEPFVTAARAAGAGVLALVRTSNPGAADVEDLELAGGGSVWERLAAIVDELGAAGVGEAGISDVG
ncbi:MAG TPA: orotidine-5'-phosphate decarboxylase, partial [Solirubrobacteraceae bacterium]|nr:orotidine-5'-phosphate decarboxylase [Solirubrobacteraceae bacterium]